MGVARIPFKVRTRNYRKSRGLQERLTRPPPANRAWIRSHLLQFMRKERRIRSDLHQASIDLECFPVQLPRAIQAEDPMTQSHECPSLVQSPASQWARSNKLPGVQVECGPQPFFSKQASEYSNPTFYRMQGSGICMVTEHVVMIMTPRI